jgi:hypothetical protein
MRRLGVSSAELFKSEAAALAKVAAKTPAQGAQATSAAAAAAAAGADAGSSGSDGGGSAKDRTAFEPVRTLPAGANVRIASWAQTAAPSDVYQASLELEREH